MQQTNKIRGMLAAIDKRWFAAYLLLILIGLGVAIRQTPFFTPDEGAHYLRAYEVGHLRLINLRGEAGVKIPCREYIIVVKKYNVIGNIQKKAEDEQNDPACLINSINSAGAYSFFPYIPAAIGLRLTQQLGWSVEHRLSLARGLNFIVWFSVLFAGLLYINKGRLLLGCLLLMPAYFWQLVAVSADGATFASCMVYVCVVLGLAQRARPISPGNLWLLVGIAVMIGASKGVYAHLALFSFSLWDQLPRATIIRKLVVLACPVVAALAVYLVLTGLADPSHIGLGNGAIPGAQIRYLVDNPMAFFSVFWTTLNEVNMKDMKDLVAPDYAVPNAWLRSSLATVAAFTIAVLISRSDFGVGKNVRRLAGALSLIAFAAIFLPLYLTYTPVGYATVLGIQSRYFLPILPFVFVAVAFNAADINWQSFQKHSGWVIVFPLLFLVWAVWTIK